MPLELMLKKTGKKAGLTYTKITDIANPGAQASVAGCIYQNDIYTYALWSNGAPYQHQAYNIPTRTWRAITTGTVSNVSDHVLLESNGILNLLFGTANGDRNWRYVTPAGVDNWVSDSSKYPTYTCAGSAGTKYGEDLIVFGGNQIWPIQRWNSQTNSWMAVREVPNNRPAYGPGASAGSVGSRIFVAGGIYNSMTFAEYFPETDTWETLPPPPFPIQLASPLVAIGTRLFVFGGNTTGFVTTKRMMEFDTVTNTWIDHGLAPAAMGNRIKPVMVAYQGKLYIYGGNLGGSPYTDMWEVTV